MANIDFLQVKAILDTLPVGYYCGRKYDVVFDKNIETSMYTFSDETIHISWNNIDTAISNLPDMSYDKLENVIRGLLYHELSHAIISPTDNYFVNTVKGFSRRYPSIDVSQVFNIVEDERIETFFAKYYHGVNFRNNLYLINGTEINISDPYTAFYALVRYHKGEEKYLKQVEALINKPPYRGKINSDWYCDYLEDIINIFKNFMKDFNNSQKQSKNGEDNQDNSGGSGTNSSNENQDNNSGFGTNSSEDIQDSNGEDENEKGQSSNENRDKSNNSNTEDIMQVGKLDVSEEFNSAMESFDNSANETEKCGVDAGMSTIISDILKMDAKYADKYYEKLKPIIIQARLEAKRNSGAITAHSGKFNPRLAGNKDYRFFTRENRLGSQQTVATSLHLNLFTDDSGSFSSNAKYVNSLFVALNRLEKECPKFSYSVIRCGSGLTLCDKDKRYVSASQGTSFRKEDAELVKSLQHKKNASVYNILMYDGYCNNSDRALGVFDTSNTTIVYEYNNENNFDKFTKARLIKTNNYTNVFIDRIIERLAVLANVM